MQTWTFTAMAALVGSASVAAAEPSSNTVSAIELKSVAGAQELVITTQRAPVFSVFRMTDPARLLVDISDAAVDGSVAMPSPALGVQAVRVSKLPDDHVVRVELSLAAMVEYDARAVGNSVVLSLGAKVADATPAATTLGRLGRKVGRDAVTLSVPFQGAAIAPSSVSIQQLNDPARVVVDVAGATAEPKWQKVNVGSLGVERARLGVQEGGVRVVLDLSSDATTPEVDVSSDAKQLVIRVSKPAVQLPAVAATAAPKAELVVNEPAPSPAVVAAPVAAPLPSTPAAQIASVQFDPKDGFYRLTVELSGDVTVLNDGQATRQQPMLRLSGVKLPEALTRTLDTSAVAGGVVGAVSTYMDGADTLLAANVGASTEHRHWQKDGKLFWDFRGTSAEPARAELVAQPAQSTAGYRPDALASAMTGQKKARYTGRRISLDLKDAEVQNVLRLLADVSQLNIIAGSDVEGRVTLKLKNVPWDQALDIILQTKGYDKVRNGNIIRIAPLAVLENEAKMRLEREKSLEALEPLNVRLVPVSYASAGDISAQASSLLSARGKLNVDRRTNVLIVEDVAEALDKIERLVRTLDTQTPQVLIEARIVQARTNFSRQLGIQWGGSFTMSQAFGNGTGLGFPSDISIAGGSGNAPAEGLAGAPTYVVNLPVGVGAGSGGGLGFTFGSAGGAALMHLRLSAAETDGKSKTISAPKIVTLDNLEAKILAGEDIPITVVTANGPSTRFIPANLELAVTPHVTTDGSVLLKVKATQNELSQRTDTFGTPGILKREAETNMLVADGETAVLGGIYRRTALESRAFVPFLGEIPVLGWLFKTTTNSDDRDELLIFISPRIVNRSQALVNAQ